ncbi:MAG: hypothetical protein ACRDKE_05545 [Solirubrobacterales bacterium]
MLKEVVITGVVGLGLVGGVGSVVQNEDGSSTVTIDDHGKKSTVTISGDGKQYSCPSDVGENFDEMAIRLGRDEITSRRIRRQLRKIDRAHPGKTAPEAVAKRYNSLVEREKRITRDYNKIVDQHNDVLKSECELAE